MNNGCLLVKHRSSGRWFCGVDEYMGAIWLESKFHAREFKSQDEFNDFCRGTWGHSHRAYFGRGNLRFVRISPRKVST
jgi:hypothetical protein